MIGADDSVGRGQDRGDCIAATFAFYAGLDRFDYGLALGAMAPDGVWERHDGTHAGHAAIGAVLERRPSTVLTAHMVFNPLVRFTGADTALVHFSLLVLAGDSETSPPVGKPHQVRHGTDEVARIDGRWVITRKASDLAFNIG